MSSVSFEKCSFQIVVFPMYLCDFLELFVFCLFDFLQYDIRKKTEKKIR